MKVIGLTGPTGAGKTIVAEFMNLPVVNADKVARTVHKDPEILARLCQRFGEDIVSGGVLNRTILASRAFATREDTDALNAIMHPAILQSIEQELKALEQVGEPYCLLDAPLLFEANCYQLCHEIVGVLAPFKLRETRIMERDGIPMELAEKRMAAQPDDGYYQDRCHYILVNNGDICELQKDVEALKEKLIKE